MRLSKHFTYAEAVKSQMAVRHEIDNRPDASALNNLEQVALHILEPPRRHFSVPFSPSSWYRCLRLNRLLGSNDDSQHAKGEAVDFEIPGYDNLRVAEWMVEHTEFDQLILEFYEPGVASSGWIHASWVGPGYNRNEILVFNNGQYTNGLPAR